MPTTPRGYPLLTADQQYALVDDYNKLAAKADAEATVTEARAQEVADAAKVFAQQAADGAERIARDALSKVEPVRALVDSANTKSDHAVTTAEAAYAYNQALVAPAAEIVNAVVTDPASEAGSLVASKQSAATLDAQVAAHAAEPSSATRAAVAEVARAHVTVGATGDYSTIKAALDAHPAGGVVIELVSTNIDLGGTLNPRGQKDVTIYGQGRTTTTVTCDGPAIAAADSSDAWTLHDFALHRANGTNADDGISVTYPRRWQISRLDVRGFGGSSIWYQGGVHSRVEFCYFFARDSMRTNGKAGIRVSPIGSDITKPPTTIVTRQNYVGAGIEYGYLWEFANIGCASEYDTAEYCQVGLRAHRSGMLRIVQPYGEQNTTNMELSDSACIVEGDLRLGEEPKVSWSTVGFFERRATRVAGNYMDPGKGLVYGGPTGDRNFDTAPSLRWDTAAPDGRLTAPVGAMTIHTTAAVSGADPGGVLWIKESGAGNTGWVPVGTREASTAMLSAAAQTVNVSGKRRGTSVFNRTTNRPVWATGPNPTDPWVYADGTTAVTPT